MTSADRLKEIDEDFKRNFPSGPEENCGYSYDMLWLITRVKKLTKALEFYARKDLYWINITSPSPRIQIEWTETDLIKDSGKEARKALESEE